MYNAVSKTLLVNCKETKKSRALLLRSTGISVVNIGGTTVHFALRIKLGAKLSGLSIKGKASIRNKLSEVNLFMINEISMVFGDLWTEIGFRLSDIFSASIELPFAGISVAVIDDYLELPPVRRSFIFSRFTSGSKMNQLLSLQLWQLFKYAELTEVATESD